MIDVLARTLPASPLMGATADIDEAAFDSQFLLNVKVLVPPRQGTRHLKIAAARRRDRSSASRRWSRVTAQPGSGADGASRAAIQPRDQSAGPPDSSRRTSGSTRLAPGPTLPPTRCSRVPRWPKSLAKQIPLGRVADVHELVRRRSTFLATPAAGHINGAVHPRRRADASAVSRSDDDAPHHFR